MFSYQLVVVVMTRRRLVTDRRRSFILVADGCRVRVVWRHVTATPACPVAGELTRRRGRPVSQ